MNEDVSLTLWRYIEGLCYNIDKLCYAMDSVRFQLVAEVFLMIRASCATVMIAMLALAPGSPGHRATIMVGPNIQVSRARETNSHNEVVIAAHPTRANWLIACAMLNPRGDLSLGTAAYISLDAGQTWGTPELSTTGWADDPTCAFGADSNIYFAS